MGPEFESPAGHQKAPIPHRVLVLFASSQGDSNVLNATCRWQVAATSANTGKQGERRLWREERPARVTAVGVQRRLTEVKAHTGYRNRGLPLSLPSGKNANESTAGHAATPQKTDCHAPAVLAMTRG